MAFLSQFFRLIFQAIEIKRHGFAPRNIPPPYVASAAKSWTGRLPMARPCRRRNAAIPVASLLLRMQKNRGVLRPNLFQVLVKIRFLLTFQMNIQDPQLNNVNLATLDKYLLKYRDQILPPFQLFTSHFG